MRAKVMRVLWSTVTRQIDWRCHNEPAYRRHQARDTRRVLEDRYAKGRVEAVADQIGMGVGEMLIYGNFRVGSKELGQQRGDPAGAEGQRCG